MGGVGDTDGDWNRDRGGNEVGDMDGDRGGDWKSISGVGTGKRSQGWGQGQGRVQVMDRDNMGTWLGTGSG